MIAGLLNEYLLQLIGFINIGSIANSTLYIVKCSTTLKKTVIFFWALHNLSFFKHITQRNDDATLIEDNDIDKVKKEKTWNNVEQKKRSRAYKGKYYKEPFYFRTESNDR